MFLHLSVTLFTGGLPHPQQTPPGQTQPLGQTPLSHWADTTPLGRHHPPGQTPPPWADPPVQCMLGYSQQAGGTHPTGMQSYSRIF